MVPRPTEFLPDEDAAFGIVYKVAFMKQHVRSAWDIAHLVGVAEPHGADSAALIPASGDTGDIGFVAFPRALKGKDEGNLIVSNDAKRPTVRLPDT